ncbi:hypothetical protein [Hydrogenophaga sp.]|uniref:hypothetical protein n=1 Tax=Hydrogenophaga sp. TaxID=1904254 RepID=UPI0025BBE4EA|nr:hypothetical protein [Hydrogenophaga sp.]
MFKTLLCLVAAWVSTSVLAQADGVSMPVVKAGEVAVFTVNDKASNRISEQILTITAVDDALIKFKTVRPDRTPAEMDGIATLEWHSVQSGSSGTRYDPPYPNLKFPLTVGSTWQGVYEATTLKGDRSKGEIDFKVVAAEKLMTPAGEFETFKIESGGWLTGVSWQGSFRMTQVQWYAPAISRIVKTEYKDYRNGRLRNDRVTELKSFKPAP